MGHRLTAEESRGRRAWPRIVRAEVAIAGGVLAIAAGAWATSAVRMAGMGGLWAHPAGAAGFAATWVVMMAAMMLPAAVPTVVAGRGVTAGRRRPPAIAAGKAVFLFGYLTAWTAAGLIAYGLLGAVPAGAGLVPAAGVVLVAAGYQLLPVKRRCLVQACAPPPAPWEGRELRTALRRGLTAGAWCLGCCWALMAALLALGMMSLTWMVVVWALIMAERLVRRRLAVLGVAIVLVGLAVAILVGVPVSPMDRGRM